jgi:hypothetical protein
VFFTGLWAIPFSQADTMLLLRNQHTDTELILLQDLERAKGIVISILLANHTDVHSARTDLLESTSKKIKKEGELIPIAFCWKSDCWSLLKA